MDAEQLNIFRQITLGYFAKLAEHDPSPRPLAPFIQFGQPRFLDYGSMVRIEGELRGCVYLTAGRAMIDRLLKLHGRSDPCEKSRRDMCRELSNVLAGNASQAFGDSWRISVPESLGARDLGGMSMPQTAFTIPVEWLGETFFLMIGLEEGSEDATDATA